MSVAQSFRDLAISYGGARRDLADNRIDPPVEVRQSAVVDCNIGQVALFAGKQRNDAFYCMPNVGCRCRFARHRITTAHARVRRRGICFGKLHPNDAVRTPDDAARSDPCSKECETLFRHAANITSALNRRRPIPGLLSSQCAAVSCPLSANTGHSPFHSGRWLQSVTSPCFPSASASLHPC